MASPTSATSTAIPAATHSAGHAFAICPKAALLIEPLLETLLSQHSAAVVAASESVLRSGPTRSAVLEEQLAALATPTSPPLRLRLPLLALQAAVTAPRTERVRERCWMLLSAVLRHACTVLRAAADWASIEEAAAAAAASGDEADGESKGPEVEEEGKADGGGGGSREAKAEEDEDDGADDVAPAAANEGLLLPHMYPGVLAILG